MLEVEGKFTATDMHNWLSLCLPELPSRPPDASSVSYTFVSSFIGTTVEVNYATNEAAFRSDNLSSIAILKDTVLKQATKQNIQVALSESTLSGVNCAARGAYATHRKELAAVSRASFSHVAALRCTDIDPRSVFHVLRRLLPKLRHQAELQRNVRTINTLKEVAAQDGGSQNLTQENRATLGL